MEDPCPKCGGEFHQTDKNTFSGEVWREYTCRQCGFVLEVNDGQALWQVLHDGAQKDRDEQGKP